MNNSVYILGAGSMARETYLIYKDQNKDNLISGFIVNQNLQKKQKINGVPVYDIGKYNPSTKNSVLIGAIGSPFRKNWILSLEKQEFLFDTAIHPSITIPNTVKINRGCILGHGVIVTCDILIGKHTIVNIGTNINHDCIIGDFVTIGPGVNIAGKVSIGNGSWIGIGSTIIESVKIGKNTFIGAGSVVINDIPDGVLAYGVPAKPIRKIQAKDWLKFI